MTTDHMTNSILITALGGSAGVTMAVMESIFLGVVEWEHVLTYGSGLAVLAWTAARMWQKLLDKQNQMQASIKGILDVIGPMKDDMDYIINHCKTCDEIHLKPNRKKPTTLYDMIGKAPGDIDTPTKELDGGGE